MASKTRDKLIDAATKVFILKGVEHTTISDIADASEKGRRTIYTYFKNKKEIFRAVIERESDISLAELRHVVDSDVDASEKLSGYVRTHIRRSLDLACQNPGRRNFFSMDFLRTERMRRLVQEKEESMLAEILAQGVDSGEFDAAQAQRLKQCLYAIIRGVEQGELADLAAQNPGLVDAMVEFAVTGVKKSKIPYI